MDTHTLFTPGLPIRPLRPAGAARPRRDHWSTAAALARFASALSCATPREPNHALHFDAIVIDGHSDTTPRFEDPSWDFAARHDLRDGHMDLPRIRDGGLDVQFWSIYMPEREVPGEALREAL